MNCCRICRKDENLKYSPKELQRYYLQYQDNEEKESLEASLTFGNICLKCDATKKIFHTLNDDDTSEIDIEMANIKSLEECSNEFHCKSVEENLQRKFREKSLGSDGNTEAIEVLTSREGSVAISICTDDESDVVELIDLDTDSDEDPEKSWINLSSDAEEQFLPKPPPAFKPLYDSDESDKTVGNAAAYRNRLKSVNCDDRSQNTKNLQFVEIANIKVSCPVCNKVFMQIKELVQHMRCKHLTYNGEVLEERPRCGYDSAMTIRLRYMSRLTFYECHICGRIDGICNEHKQHILQQHPDECELLKESKIKKLKCPLCKDPCGKQYLNICRHLLSHHTASECEFQLREISRLPGRPRKVNQTARMYQLTKCKQVFFECRTCKQVDAGFLSHKRHLKKHDSSDIIELNLPSPIVQTHLQMEDTKNMIVTAAKTPKTELIESKVPLPMDKTNKLILTTLSKGSLRRGTKLKQTPAVPQNKLKDLSVVAVPNMKKISSKVPKIGTRTSKAGQPQNEQDNVRIASTAKQSKMRLVKEETEKPNPNAEKEKPKISHRAKESILKKLAKHPNCKIPKKVLNEALTKIKVKSNFVRRVSLKMYACKHCKHTFKGYLRWHSHQLREHIFEDYKKCTKCLRFFTNHKTMTQHNCQKPNQKRTMARSIVTRSFNNVDENCNKTQPMPSGFCHQCDKSSSTQELSNQRICQVQNNKEKFLTNYLPPRNEGNALWLHELEYRQQLKQEMSDRIFYCEVCKCYFYTGYDFDLHMTCHAVNIELPLE